MLNENMVVIGRTTVSEDSPDAAHDSSVSVKKGQLGYVDLSSVHQKEKIC